MLRLVSQIPPPLTPPPTEDHHCELGLENQRELHEREFAFIQVFDTDPYLGLKQQ